ncbi:MAG: hypothetical protein IT215_00865 [Chitinophagaceae bacterium]|nr:MAG: hypothetical protein UZ11_BCD004001007 [Bacteroidetes bacterium OLB11]MCC6447222.1 hypothetical protein [Chitinophagaceae bacterium]HMN33039.1 hypothetical protein [Chitinophagaceae bacterium]
MKRLKGILILCFGFSCTLQLSAEVTHGVSFQVGLTNSLYKSTIKGVQNVPKIFMPSFALEYGRFSENLFWGGAAFGLQMRNIPFYKYTNGNTLSVGKSEYWLKVKTGLHIHNEFLTHLPFISLGAGIYGKSETRYKSQNGIPYNNLGNYKNFNLQNTAPFVELGTTMINSSFTENKRNIFITLSMRYYPLPVFKSNTDIEYAPYEVVTIQYQLFEFNIIAGIQQNLRR